MKISWTDFSRDCLELLPRLKERGESFCGVFGIPSGGACPASFLAAGLGLHLLPVPFHSCLMVDDLVDSGATMKRWQAKPHSRTVSIYCKESSVSIAKALGVLVGRVLPDEWILFPWEEDRQETGPEDAVVRLLQFIGEDPRRDGLLDTPKRVVKALAEMTEGYKQDPQAILSKTFDESYDEVVVVKAIPFTSLCEHHMLPFSGTVDIGYLPGKVVGLSKLARLVDCFSKRLQIQEKMTRQIANAIETSLEAKGVAVVVKASHSCMSCRGVKKHGVEMVTSTMLGVFRDKPEARSEFLSLSGK